jgi:uncharacterized protein
VQTYFFAEQSITYNGRQLSPHWLYRQFDLLGDTIAAFTGPCRVELNEMVDPEDVKATAPIYSPLMLHCILRSPSDATYLCGDQLPETHRRSRYV